MDDGTTYEGYQLDDKYTWELTKKEAALLDACVYLVDNKCTIRKVCKDFDIFTKSTLHRYIHTNLRSLSFELYKCVCRVLKHNETKKIGGVNFGKHRISRK